MSLRELSDYCSEKFGIYREVKSIPENRPFDIPYYVTDNTLVQAAWGWLPELPATTILDSIALWAETNRTVVESGF